MKKITFLFSVLVALATGIKAQDVGIVDILTPASDTTIAVGANMPLVVALQNFGTATLNLNDTIYVELSLNGQVMFGSSVPVSASLAPFAPDEIVLLSFGTLPLGQAGIPAGTYQLCVSTAGTNINGAMVADPNASNDESCFQLTIGNNASVEEKSLAQFSAFPNPANNMINVVSPVAFETVRLFDMAGREVYSFNGKETNHQINVSNLPVGLYFLSIEAEGNKSTKKVSIAR